MVEQIYQQLKTPKTLEELQVVLEEIGLKWNKAQIQLFLYLDKKIVKNGDKYHIKEDNSYDSTILEAIDKAMGARPMIPIKKVMDYIAGDAVVSVEDIIRIALKSGKYINPNAEVLKRQI